MWLIPVMAGGDGDADAEVPAWMLRAEKVLADVQWEKDPATIRARLIEVLEELEALPGRGEGESAWWLQHGRSGVLRHIHFYLMYVDWYCGARDAAMYHYVAGTYWSMRYKAPATRRERASVARAVLEWTPELTMTRLRERFVKAGWPIAALDCADSDDEDGEVPVFPGTNIFRTEEER